MSTPENPTRSELLEQYKVLVEEYRFAVQLGWDRAKNVITLVVAIFGVATGLLKLEGPGISNVLVTVLYGVGSFSAWHGVAIVENSHEYYRKARDHMVSFAVKHQDLKECVIETTGGAQDAAHAVRNPGIQRIPRWTITKRITMLLRLPCAMGIVGTLISAHFAALPSR